MRYFNNDYNEVCHPEILRAFAENVGVQMPGYSTDSYCSEAAELIRQKCDAPNAAVHFLVGGTQTNLTVIAASLRLLPASSILQLFLISSHWISSRARLSLVVF